MSNGYYEQAIHHKNSQVWVGFDRQEGSYHTSSNYSDEKDAKQTNIGTLANSRENIEDRYFGEPNTTYSEDQKYYKGTPFSPSDGSFHHNAYQPQKNSFEQNWELFLFSGIFIFALLKIKK